MISLTEIKQQADKQYLRFVKRFIQGEGFTRIMIRGVKYDKNYSQTRTDWIKEIAKYRKTETQLGYTIETEEKKRQGQDIIKSIYFSTQEDFLYFIGKQLEFEDLTKKINFIVIQIPELKPWILDNLSLVFKNQYQNWQGIINVCRYFLKNPRPNVYLRQIDADIDTKFIETNTSLLISLLDYLIPNDIKDNSVRKFEKRYYVDFEEKLLRIRFLDPQTYLHPLISNIGIIMDEAKNLEIPNCKNVLIVENQTSFIAFQQLPIIPNTIAIWGKGFAVVELQYLNWLKDKKVFYWGDIDAHGLQILHEFRKYYPNCINLMMDMETLKKFSSKIIQGKTTKITQLPYLTSEELTLFDYLQSNNLRLEQERIDRDYFTNKLITNIK